MGSGCSTSTFIQDSTHVCSKNAVKTEQAIIYIN